MPSNGVGNGLPVSPPGQAPIAQDDFFVVGEDGALIASLFDDNGFGNDTDPNGDIFSVGTINGQPLVSGEPITVFTEGGRTGEITAQYDGMLRFTPSSQFESLAWDQTDTIELTYSIFDGRFFSARPASVIITITGANDAPSMVAGVMTATEDGPMVEANLAMLGDDVDSDDDGTTLSYTVTEQPSEGNASISGTTLIFDPSGDFQDLDTGETRDVVIQVTATDAHGADAVNYITVTVEGLSNDAVILESFELGLPNQWTRVGDVGTISGTQDVTQTHGDQSLIIQGTGATEEQIEGLIGYDLRDDVSGGTAISRSYYFEGGDVVSFDFRSLIDSSQGNGFYIDPNEGLVVVGESGNNFESASFVIPEDGYYDLIFGSYYFEDSNRDLAWMLLDNIVIM